MAKKQETAKDKKRGKKDAKKAKKAAKGKKKGQPAKTPLFLRLFRWGIVLALWGMIALGVLLAWYARDLSDVTRTPQFERKAAITIKAADGSTVTRYGELKGVVVPIEDLPSNLLYAVMAVEDRRFYEHGGIDPVGIVRAAAVNLARRGVVQGGSTITQQLAKNLFLSHERTLKRKIQEVMLALWLEHELTKDEILTAYLNRVYFGSGAYGIEAAANTYFDKHASELSLRESALIAGLLKAPSRYSPLNNPELADKRADIVLAAMRDAGYITESAETAGKGRKFTAPATRPGPVARDSRYFTDYVVDRLDELVGTPNEDLIVETTLMPDIQRTTEKALESALDAEGESRAVTQGAALVMHRDGAIVAMVGGRDYGKSQFNRATQAYRPPGSAFKPVVYMAALENGWRSSDRIEDAPVEQGNYRPKNFRDEYAGRVTLEEALTRSLNTATVRLAQEVGIPTVIATARRLGIEAPLSRDLSLSLGSSGIPMFELVRAYGVLANEGRAVEPFVITRITSADGELYYERSSISLSERIIDFRNAREMTAMLGRAVDYGTGRAARLPDRPAFGKTGTSQDYRDAWFVGYTKDYVAAVWVGNDDNSPMKGITGGTLPARIWRETMEAANRASPPDTLFSRETGSGFGSLLSRLLDAPQPHSESYELNR
ncbi:MAG: PBP1A family penicillin-binding protein [Alphaproteobacteria bacterium]|nr:PBP1A family penicillin-binding protein [Alphaproteobacteria bacterium]